MNLPFTVCPSHSCIKLVTHEEGNTYVEFKAWYELESRYELIRITFQRAICTRSLPWLITESRTGIGQLSPTSSQWLSQLIAAQIKRYPEHPEHFSDMKHYYIGGHDTAVEVIAEGFEWTTVES